MATVADAESVLVWGDYDKVALDSQGVIQRIWSLQHGIPLSWIEEALRAQMQARPKTLMWVKGHQGTEENEKADESARIEVEMGQRMLMPDIATPAGIRQAYPTQSKAPAHAMVPPSRRAIRGLTYMMTDKGPQWQWLWEIGRSEEPQCVCEGWTAQNAAHPQLCPWVGDGMGRSTEQVWYGVRGW